MYSEGVSTHTQDTHHFFTRVVPHTYKGAHLVSTEVLTKDVHTLTKDVTKDLHSKKGTQGGIIFQNDFLDITDNQVSNNKS